MKELSIKEKAKRYDEAIERYKAKQEYESQKVHEFIEYLFPELKESGDERIKKELIRFVKGYFPDEASEQRKSYLAWIEKQNETFTKKDVDDAYLRGVCDAKHELEKQEWSDEDERIYQSIIDDTVQENQLNDKQTHWLKGIKYRYFPQPKQEWSEEDERLCLCLIENQEKALEEVKNDKYGHSEIISDLKEIYRKRIDWLKSLKDRVGCEVNCTTTKDWSEEDELRTENILSVIEGHGYPIEVEWIKSLKGRVQPQPKQEWDEEDCNQIENALFGTYAVDVATRLLNKLKSLKPQNHWKPTGAQLASLEIACDRNDRIGFDLTELLKGLKKYGGCSMLPQWKPSNGQLNTLRDAIVYVEGCNSNFKGSGSVLEKLYNDLKRL